MHTKYKGDRVCDTSFEDLTEREGLQGDMDNVFQMFYWSASLKMSTWSTASQSILKLLIFWRLFLKKLIV